jgi:cell division protein FtsQ
LSAGSISHPSDLRTGLQKRGSGLRRTRRLWPWVVALLAMIAGLAWWAAHSPLFRLRTLEVAGQAHLASGEVARLAGLDKDTSVLWLDTAEAEARIEANPWVGSATVRRDLPGTVTILVVERLPVGAVAVAEGGGWLVVSGDGTVLEQISTDPRLPLIATDQGFPVGARPPSLSAPAAALRAMGEPLRSRVSSLRMRDSDHLVIRLTDGIRVLYGPPSELDAKARALDAVLDWTKAHPAEVVIVDVRAPTAPTAIPRVSAGNGGSGR